MLRIIILGTYVRVYFVKENFVNIYCKWEITTMSVGLA